MISNRLNSPNFRRLQMRFLLCALFVLPIGLAHGQDYQAVSKRLKAAVAAEEISGKQARIMLSALKKTDKGKQKEKELAHKSAKEHYAAAEKKMKHLVSEGEISVKDATAQLREFRQTLAKQHEGHSEHMKRETAQVKEKREEKEHAKARKIDWDSINKRVEGAVERGDLTREEANQKYQEIKQRIKKGQQAVADHTQKIHRITREEYAKAEAKIKAMVEKGEASAEDARTRLREMRQALAAQHNKQGELHAKLKGLSKQIEDAVERGDLTRDEANKKHRIIRQKMSNAKKESAKQAQEKTSRKKKADDLDWKVIKQRIEGAVKRGDISREEADAVYRTLKK